MPLSPKSRFLRYLLLLLMLVPVREVRPADAPIRAISVAPSQSTEATLDRESRSLSRREIFRAIQEDLARRGVSGRDELRPEELNIQSSVPVLKEDMGLQVNRIGFDSIRRETVFEIWTSRAPKYLPFEVTTRRDPESLGLTPHPKSNLGDADGKSPNGNSAIGRVLCATRSKLPVLVKPGGRQR